MTLASITLSSFLVFVALFAGWLLRGLAERRSLSAHDAGHAAELTAAESRFAAERTAYQAQVSNLTTELAAANAVSASTIQRLTEEIAARESVAKAREEAPIQVAGAMAPVQVTLAKLEESLQRAERHRAVSTAELAEQLKSVVSQTTTSSDGLRRETARLAGALSQSDVRGKWGEFQLHQLLVGSGLLPGYHFDEQVTVDTDDGSLRPDVVIHVGTGKDVVVDAKVSLRSILNARAEDSESAMAAVRAAHAKEVRNHVDRLASKEYARQFDTAPEAVVMFLPAESLLSDAIQGDPALVEHAFSRNVILASPTTMMLLLRTVAHIWRQDEIAANAREVQALGRELADRMRTTLTHLDKVGSAMTSGVKAYNSTIASMESRVLVTGRRFTELQGLPDLPMPKQVEVTPRNVVALPGTLSSAGAVSSPGLSSPRGTVRTASAKAHEVEPRESAAV